ncbi:MAG: hypothetical protein PW843_27930 [Azospirillaceae bacterium]|nr:hypothetical protein [Azospirillaceae bacterium]
MGHEDFHVYRFDCQACGEEMEVGLRADYQTSTHSIEEVGNCENVQEESNFIIVNTHANFVIPDDMRNVDGAFPHLSQMYERARIAEASGSLVRVADISGKNLSARPYRRPDIENEWQKLKKSWSLFRRNRIKLSENILREASDEFYSNEPLDGIQDWLWRFALYFTGTSYEVRFRDALDIIRPEAESGKLSDVMIHYSANLVAMRSQKYFDILREYFSGWSEFSQVHFSVGQGMTVGSLAATSVNFNSVKMYYGNAFEALGSFIDILTMINNVKLGRSFDQLSTISLEKYLTLDKANRFSAFSENLQFSALCEEHDNQLRNASHHGDLVFNREVGDISYRTGKGADGKEVIITYADYLQRCSRVHHQIILLLRIELLLCRYMKVSCPI